MTAPEPLTLDRRRFLAGSATLLAGLVVAFYVPLPRALAADEDKDKIPPTPPPDPNAFVHVAPDGTVTVLLAHSEMGQGMSTGLAMLVAEELHCAWKDVRIEHAPAAPQYARPGMPVQMTGGSSSTKSEFERYRRAGALARELLVAAAAKRWGVDPAAVHAENGAVVHGSDRLAYGELAAEAAKLPPPKSVTLAPPESWTLIGKPTKRIDSTDKVTARAEFGLDVKLPGLLTAVVARSPVFGGKVKSFKGERAAAVPGVKGVFEIPSGVAVVADGFWNAKRARDLLTIEWDLGDGGGVDTDRMREEYRRLAGEPGAPASKGGDVEKALGSAAKVVEAEYDVPYLAHAPMEPLNCTVRIGADGCDVWAGTQSQTVDQKAVAKELGLPIEKVRIHTTFLGGGFGRRASPNGETPLEAARIAKAAGAPVRTVWTREDDMRGGFYRPMFLHRIRAGIDASGRLVAWKQDVVGQSIFAGSPLTAARIQDGVDPSSVEGAADSPWLKEVPDRLISLHTTRGPVPVLWWRSVGHTHTAFAIESFVDELAHAAGVDPIEYRRRLLKTHPRPLGALELAVEKAGTGALPAGRARGVAVHESFGSFVALVVEVSADGGAIRVHRAVSAIDCGTCVNPAGVQAQLEGATAFGLAAALYGRIDLKEGRVQQSNFHDYPILRMPEMPKVEAFVVPSKEKPGGVGEPGVPPVAPAVANALFALTGKRLRRLPLRLEEAGK